MSRRNGRSLKMETKWCSNLFSKLVLIVFISGSVTSDALSRNHLANQMSYPCQTPGGCHSGPQSVHRSSESLNQRRYPVYQKPSGGSHYNSNNGQDYSNFDQSPFQQSPSGIRNHISHVNNMTLPNFETQYFSSSLIKDSYDGFTQSPYYEKEVKYYNPNGTDYLSLEVASSPVPKISKKEDFDPYFGNILDYIPVGSEFTLETKGFKLALIIVSFWYLLIAVLVQVSRSGSDYSQCDGGSGPDSPLIHVNVEAEPHHYIPYEDSSVQQQVYDMFQHNGHSDQDDSMEMPDLSRVASMCSKDAFYYGMNSRYMQAVQMTMDIFMDQPGVHEMMAMAKALLHSPDMNPKVWYEALMKSCHERSDMGGMIMPGPMDAMPDNFIPGHAFDEARSLRNGRYRKSYKGRSHNKKDEQKCIRVDGSVGRDNGIENLLWYFREDVLVNSHHWYWHLSFPLVSKIPRDRRGELFYFAHRSMLNRYNIERISNGLEIVGPMDTHPGAPIPDGYNTHLNDINSGMPWTDRPPGVPLSDINHQDNPDGMVILLNDWSESARRVVRSIKKGYFISRKGMKLAIPNYEGIDIVGNTLESTDLSVNPMYYGMSGYHNDGHQIIGAAVDPDFHLRLPPGPMGDPATAMRDPVFYRWHTNINNIFQKHKSTLKPYQLVGGEFPLLWNGVEVHDVKVISKGGGINDLATFFSRRKFELSLGLSLLRNETDDDNHLDHLKVCAKHLDHTDFEYQINIERKPCAKSETNSATIRIFIAPKFDIHGRRLKMEEQRRLFTHLDLFTTKLSIGKNIITRRSKDSTLTIPWTASLRQLEAQLENPSPPYCGCGWPHHLLLPRGSPDGMPFDIFVMVTNGDEDLVVDHSSPFGGMCRSAPIYCGIPNRKYPDARPMGYPFDRDLYKTAKGCYHPGKGFSVWSKLCSLLSFVSSPPAYLEEYMAGITNMGSTTVVITHKD